jgi:hypothetical protein
MEKPKKFPILLLLLAFACLIVMAVVFATRPPKPPPPPADKSAGPSGQSGTSAGSDRPERPRGKRPPPAGGVPSTGGSEAVAALVGDSSLSDAEVIAGLRRIVDDAGRKLDERLEALDHALNLIPDDNPDMLHGMAANRVLPDEVRQRLLSDALNRPAKLQGRLLVKLLENAAGDTRKELLGELSGLCGKDHGDDPAAWRKAVEELPDNP